MTDRQKRSVFESGHYRKFLVVVDETPEVESALAFAANRVRRSGGSIALLYVIEPPERRTRLAAKASALSTSGVSSTTTRNFR